MAPRQSQTSVPVRKLRNTRQKPQKRALNAFAIAEVENPERSKVRKHRLGESDLTGRKQKRQRVDNESDTSEEDQHDRSSSLQKRSYKDSEDMDFDEGSDSEGNTWQMGHVDDDDDSSIDSDEAFGDSDEERFEDFTFRGSSKNRKRPQSRRATVDRDLDLDEGEEEEDEDEDDDSLGEDAVDLATMLDNYDEDEVEERSSGRKNIRDKSRNEIPGDSEDEDDSTSQSNDSDIEDESGDGSSLAKIQQLISSLDQTSDVPDSKSRKVDSHESNAPTESMSTSKLSLDDLLPTFTHPQMKKATKLLQREAGGSSRRDGIPGKLEAPLPKRQQDRLDRIAANEHAKKTLERWMETVKQNRRADHLTFPLKDPDAAEPEGLTRLAPVGKPSNDLEAAIQSILLESGLTGTGGKADEENLQKYEELQAKKLPVEEVMRRRAELRQARELLFREEIRAKRVKKIKSKAYRRVHRKERDREMQRERDLLAADGVDLSEEEREQRDRRRAEERMGAKHRDSKWAKGMKKSGRTVWDDDARAGVTEMARRNEELRRRIEGKDVNQYDDNNLSSNADSESDDEPDNDADASSWKHQRLLGKLSQVDQVNDAPDSFSKLAALPFMKRAEAQRKFQNDEDIVQLRKELGENEDSSEDEDGDQPAILNGRRKYGPKVVELVHSSDRRPEQRSEFEERDESESTGEQGDDLEPTRSGTTASGKSPKSARHNSNQRREGKLKESPLDDPDQIINPWLSGKKKKNGHDSTQLEVPLLAENPWLAEEPEKKQASGGTKKTQEGSKKAKSRKEPAGEILSAPDADGWVTVSYGKEVDDVEGDSDADEDREAYAPYVIRNQELVRRGFAGEDVVADFEEEKRAAIDDEGEKIIDETLPGWGSWTGEGIGKRQQKRNKGKVLRKQEGIKAQDRKDAKLDRVIINEKRVKKNTKYMADQLPHQFESKQQYERALRLPKGPEWQTKQTYQDGTKPRVLLKQGIILPPTKPLV